MSIGAAPADPTADPNPADPVVQRVPNASHHPGRLFASIIPAPRNCHQTVQMRFLLGEVEFLQELRYKSFRSLHIREDHPISSKFRWFFGGFIKRD